MRSEGMCQCFANRSDRIGGSPELIHDLCASEYHHQIGDVRSVGMQVAPGLALYF